MSSLTGVLKYKRFEIEGYVYRVHIKFETPRGNLVDHTLLCGSKSLFYDIVREIGGKDDVPIEVSLGATPTIAVVSKI